MEPPLCRMARLSLRQETLDDAAVGDAIKKGTSRNSTAVAISQSKIVNKLQKIEENLKVKEYAAPPWIKTPQADTCFGLVILLNAGFIGIDLELGSGGFSLGFWIVETIFLFIFLVELTWRIIAECPTPWRFFMKTCWQPDWWGIFDFLVTVLGCLDAWLVTPILAATADGGESPMSSFTVLRIFRLVRLARLIRVLRMFNELVILVQTLANSMKAVGWMSLLLGMIIYTGSVICVILLGEQEKDNEEIDKYFGSLGDALFSHFCVVTLEAWPEIAKAAMQQHPMWALYFVAMITLTNFALVNLMVGVIVERIIHFSLEQENELSAFVAESEQFRATLLTLWNEADYDQNGSITREELRQLMEDKRTHQIMEAFGINLDIPPHTLFTIMDINSDGETTFEDFFNACMRLCGSKQSVHSMFVQHDVCQSRNNIMNQLTDLKEALAEQGSRVPGVKAPLVGVADGSGTTGSPENQYAQAAAGTPEECVAQLLERMDRFGQVQSKIFQELETLKEQAKKLPSQDANMDSRIGGGLRESTPRDMGAGCSLDSLFCRRKERPQSNCLPCSATVAKKEGAQDEKKSPSTKK